MEPGEEEREDQEEAGQDAEAAALDSDLPIDRGWAWVILAASFFTILIGIGYLKAFGIIFVESKRILETSTFHTTIIIGVQQAVFSVGGLLTQTVLLTYLSVRQCVMMGGLVLSAGIVFTIFVDSITFFIFTQSLLVGLGVSLMANPCFTLIGQYFVKHRGFAIAFAGIAINVGGIIVPQLLVYLLQEYKFKGTLLIHGGLTLNIIVCGALLRPFDYYTKLRSGRRRKKFADKKMPESMQPLVNGKSGVDGMDEEGMNMEEVLPTVKGDEIVTSPSDTSSNGCKGKQHSDSSDCQWEPKEQNSHEGESVELIPKSLTTDGTTEELTAEMADSSITMENNAGYHLLPVVKENENESHAEMSASTSRLPITDTPSLSPEIRKIGDDQSSGGKRTSLLADCSLAAKPTSGGSIFLGSCWTRFIAAFEFSLFKKPEFLIILSMSFVGVLPAALIGVYIPSLAVEMNQAAFGSLHLTISNCCAIVSRIFLGFLVDKKLLELNTIFVAVQSLSAIAPFFTRFYTDFPRFLALSLTYGFLGDVFFTMQPLLIVEMLGLEKLARTLGFVMLVNGFSLAVVTPFSGWLKDTTGNYEASFMLFGVAALLCAALVGAYGQYRKCTLRRQRMMEETPPCP